MHAPAFPRFRLATSLALVACCAGFIPQAQAVRLTGSIDARSSDGGSGVIAFNCEGESPCRGQYISVFRSLDCPDDDAVVDAILLTGLDVSKPGPVSGTLTLAAISGPGPCSSQPGSRSDFSSPFTGNWNGTSATLAFPPVTEGSTVTTLTGTARAVSQLVEITGSFSGTGAGSAQGSFSCQGMSPCTGNSTATFRDPGCSNGYAVNDQIAILGLDLSAPGPISGGLLLRNANLSSTVGAGGSCTYRITGQRDGGARFTGTWDGTTGVIQLLDTDYPISGRFTATTRTLSTATAPPVFPMTVTTNITATTASATAAIQFRPQDLGTTASIYAFAVAPQDRVLPATSGAPLVIGKSRPANGAKDTPVACVLAQLNGSGQLQAASLSGLQAFLTTFLSSQGQSVPVIGGVPTGGVAGATFYVGYGSNSNAMFSGGINRSVVTVPGSQLCQPGPPQTGWWWNADESGRGYTIEVAGRNLFFSSYLYDATGRSTWYIAAGPTSLDGSLFVGNLESYANGQTLTGAYRPPTLPPANAGPVILAFNTAYQGTLTWPGGIVPIRRFEYGTGGVNAVAQPNQPESGWWWNKDEGGRGFFFEWQAGIAFMAGFLYEADGHPVWHISAAGTPDPQAFSGNWEQYANGQTLTGTYRKPDLVNPAVGPATIRFLGAQDAIMTLPGGRAIPLTRQRF